MLWIMYWCRAVECNMSAHCMVDWCGVMWWNIVWCCEIRFGVVRFGRIWCGVG